MTRKDPKSPSHKNSLASRREDAEPDGQAGFELSKSEKGEVEDKRPPRPVVMHEVIRREGEQELARNIAALLWSSIAAGLTMGFSFIARALLHRHLGDFPASYLIENFGYCFGFIVVIIARQQLFTENTMTAVLPLVTNPSFGKFASLLRLWTVVLIGNLVGVALFSYGILHLQQFDEQTQSAFRAAGTELMRNTSWQMFTKGILAGWLIAMMVWLLAGAENSKLTIIVIVTYLIAIAGCTHIVVGSAEALYLVFAGAASFSDYALHFALPTLIGNVVGGSFIFALISHAQVRSDAEHDERP